MDRRNFLKVLCAGTMTLFLSGCGIAAVDEKAVAKNVSEGGKMKIVVINSSPHSDLSLIHI